MRAITIVSPGGPDVLTMSSLPRPTPASGEVVVRVLASGVNRADVLQRRGAYPAPPGALAHVPGLEFAGLVETTSGSDAAWKVGDRVMGIIGGGAYAEFVAVPSDHLIPIPSAWSFEMAAAVPEAFITAHDALSERANLQRGERVLVHAVGSGVGLAVLQLAKAHDAVVAGSSRTAAKLERAAALGLDKRVLVTGAFAPKDDLRDWADIICDLVGGSYLFGNLVAAAPRGRIVVIGLTGGRTSEIDLGRLLSKRLTLVGTVLRSRSSAEKAQITRSFIDRVLPLFVGGVATPTLDRVFPAAEAGEAHRYMEDNRNFGAIVLSWSA